METKRKSKKSHNNDITDLNNKMMIAFKVLQTCDKEKEKCKNTNINTLERVALITGMPKHILSKIWEKSNTTEFIDAINYTVFESPETEFARQALITNYVMINKIPTVKSLQITFPHSSLLEIRQFLKRSGLIWKQIPNTKRAIIIESPERSIQRQRYLQQMDYYRRQKRSIVYVEEKIIDKHLPEYNCFKEYMTGTVRNACYVVLVAVATKTGYISGTIITGQTVSECQKLIEENFMKNILPRLPTSSVIILEDRLNLSTSMSMNIPTIESEKSAMMDWLNINNIPYDEQSHRVELLELIENCKLKSDLHKFDAMVRVRGHELLRRPAKMNYLNFFKPLWRDIFKEKGILFSNDMVTDKSTDYWLQLEDALVAYEKLVYKEDIDLENVIDKILTMAQYSTNTKDIKRWADAECDEDTLKQREYVVNCRTLKQEEYINCSILL